MRFKHIALLFNCTTEFFGDFFGKQSVGRVSYTVLVGA